LNENEKKIGDWKGIIGGILLIAVLFAGVKLVFWGLGAAIHQDIPDTAPSGSFSQSAVQSGEAEVPSFCVHCGRELPDSFQWGQFCPYCGKKVE